MNPPGIVMIRESTLPTTTVNLLAEGSREEIMERFNFTEHDLLGYEIDSISAYLKHPMFESNINRGLYRSLHIQANQSNWRGRASTQCFVRPPV